MNDTKETAKTEKMVFEMTEKETAAANAFCEEHLAHARHMSAGEAFQFIFMPTFLGDGVSVRCLTCGEVKDITDTEKF